MKTRWISPGKIAALVAGALVLLIASSSAALANNPSEGDGQQNIGAATAALYKLQSNFHQAASAKDINLLMSLFATDATFVGFRIVRPVEEQGNLKGYRSKITLQSR